MKFISFFSMLLQRFKPAVKKKYLLFIASLVWLFAGSMLLIKGTGMLSLYPDEIWWKVLLSIPLGVAFYVFMFSKIFRKHSQRIINMSEPKPCLFSFFNFKAYLMMTLMISMGVFLRTSQWVSFRYLAILYITMAIPLLISAIMFFISGKKYFSII